MWPFLSSLAQDFIEDQDADEDVTPDDRQEHQVQGEHLTTVVDEGVRIERQPAPGRSENGLRREWRASSRLPLTHRRQDVRFRVAAPGAGEMVRDVGLCHRGLNHLCTRC